MLRTEKPAVREMRGNEVEFVLMGMHLYSWLVHAADEKRVEDRIRGAGRWVQYRTMAGHCKSLLDGVAATMPGKTWHKCRKTAMMQELHLRAKGTAVDPDGEYIVIPKKTHFAVLEAGLEKCLICEGTAEDMKKCRLRQAFKDLAIVDFKVIEAGGVCAGKELQNLELNHA